MAPQYEATRSLLDDDGPSQFLLGILAAADPLTTTASPWVPLAVVLICFVMSAILSGSEAGFLAMSRLQILSLKEQGNPRADLMLRITEDPAQLVSALMIANTTINVLLAIAWSLFISALLAGAQLGDASTIALAQTLFEVLVLTVILVIFAEVTPKAWAHNNPVPFCSAVAPIMVPVIAITRPAVAVFQFLSRRILALFGISGQAQQGVTEAEIIQLLAASEESGVIDEDERELIHSIFEFGDLEVAQVMVPRVNMSSVADDATLEQAMRVALEAGHSRLPVHAGDRDHIVGILHIKDVLRLLTQPTATEMEIRESGLMRPVAFVPERKPIAMLFTEMKADKNHLVIVVDEYGGTAGLITIEDLLEELVGDIVDESDIEEPDFRFTRAGELFVDGQMALHELEDLIAWQAPEDGVETIGGLVFAALGRVPDPEEEVDLGGLPVQVMDVEENRIREIRIPDPPLTPVGRDILLRHFPDAILPQLPDEMSDEAELRQ